MDLGMPVGVTEERAAFEVGPFFRLPIGSCGSITECSNNHKQDTCNCCVLSQIDLDKS